MLDLSDDIQQGALDHARRRDRAACAYARRDPGGQRTGIVTGAHEVPALDLPSMLFVFMLSSFIGLGVIRRVSRLLHTPLMSLTNAISAIAVVGAILVTGGDYPPPIRFLGAVALFASMTNIVSGFLITDRMLKMFKTRGRRRQGGAQVTHTLVQLAYIVATALFIFSLHWMSDPTTARRGVTPASAAWRSRCSPPGRSPRSSTTRGSSSRSSLGFVVGVPLSQVPLTAVPQRTALSHAFGGVAAGLVGTAKYYLWLSEGPENLTTVPHGRDHPRDHPRLPDVHRQPAGRREAPGGEVDSAAPGHVSAAELRQPRPARAGASASAGAGAAPDRADLGATLFPVVIVLSLIFGVLLIIPIGGADMPTVISILNSYAGLSAVAMGFVLDNKLLITAGALDGSSGLILAIIMCKAMNRSFTNVLFGAFGQVQAVAATGEEKAYKAETVEGAAQILEQANLVVIIPGYGMAVAQAQHKVREVYDAAARSGASP